MTTFYGSYTISSQHIYPFNSIATTSKCKQSELPGRGWLGEITMTLWILSSSSLPSINFIECSLGTCSSLQLWKVRNKASSPACDTGEQSCMLIRETEQLNNIQSNTNYSIQKRFAFKMLKTAAPTKRFKSHFYPMEFCVLIKESQVYMGSHVLTTGSSSPTTWEM